jgi:hypothetical protein
MKGQMVDIELQDLSDSDLEIYEERAAIMEYDGELSRTVAEHKALILTLGKRIDELTLKTRIEKLEKVIVSTEDMPIIRLIVMNSDGSQGKIIYLNPDDEKRYNERLNKNDDSN